MKRQCHPQVTVQKTLDWKSVPQMSRVRTTDGHVMDWDRHAIVAQLLKETQLSKRFYRIDPITEEEAEEIAKEVEARIKKIGLKSLSGPLVRELVNVTLLERGHPEWRNIATRVGTPVYDAHQIDVGEGFEANENANLQENAETSHKKKADKISKEQYLLLLPPKLSDLHLSGDIHIHDLEYLGTRSFCMDWDLRYFFYYGLMPDGSGTKSSVAGPAKKAEVAILHAVKALGSAQTNFAGGQGFYNFLTFLAPYLEGMSYEEIEQLMQMFVYEMSVAHDEIVPLMKDDGQGGFTFKKIGEFVDEVLDRSDAIDGPDVPDGWDVARVDGWKTFAFDRGSKEAMTPQITMVARHRAPRTLYEIKTESHRSVKVTESHSVFTMDDCGEIIPVKVSELEEGDYVAIPRILNFKDVCYDEELDLIPMLEENASLDGLRVCEVRNFLESLRNDLGDFGKVGKLIKRGYKDVSRWYDRDSMPLSVFIELIDSTSTADRENDLKDILKEFGVRIKVEQSNMSFSPTILMSDDLLRLLGYYVSEGWASDDGVHIAAFDQEIIKDVIACVKRVFGAEVTPHGNEGKIIFGGRFASILFSSLLGCGKDSHSKRIPTIIFTLPEGKISQFLSAYWSGDGHIPGVKPKNGELKNRGGRIAAYTVSELLASDLLYLFLRLGITAKCEFVSGEERGEGAFKASEIYKVCVSTAAPVLKRFAEIVTPVHQEKAKRLQEMLKACNGSAGTDRKDILPNSHLILSEIENSLGTVNLGSTTPKYHKNVTRETLSELLEEYRERIDKNTPDEIVQKIKNLEKFVYGSARLDRIVSMKEVEYTEPYVYDFVVRPDGRAVENFVGGFGGIYLHNTQMMVARGGQLVFSSVQLAPGVPKLWMDKPVVYRGRIHNGDPDQAPLRTYSEFEREVRISFKALMKVMLGGDYWGKPFNFPKPEISIEPYFIEEDEGFNAKHPDLPTYSELYDLTFELSAKFGTPYFDNQIPAYRGAGEGISCYQCCAYNFSSNADTDSDFDDKLIFKDGKHFSMGAWQVISVNCPRAAYRANHDDEALFNELKRMMDIAVQIHKIKREWMNQIVDAQRMPFATQRPLDPITKEKGSQAVDLEGLVYEIGVVGINEMVEHHTGHQLHESKDAWKLAIRAMTEMEFYSKELSEEHGMTIALARTPAETTVGRFAVADILDPRYSECAKKVVKGDITRALASIHKTRDLPIYYTNGTHVPPGAGISLAERIGLEHVFFPIVDGGNIMHIFLGESTPDPKGLRDFAMRIAKNTQTGYFAFTRDMTICTDCSHLAPGLKDECPNCGSTNVEQLSRVTGYLQAVSGWNAAKKQELEDRKRYGESDMV
ncbi:MAG: DNA polymerase [Candidatus Methanogaster sp.]|nr:MAG: DNA polymerase [ANME-2 cluster archaeon]